MTYSANQYNYATPLSSAPGFISDTLNIEDHMYFTLADNVLDGRCVPITGDVGLFGTSISDADGVLPEPFIITVVDNLYVNAFCFFSSIHCYPVAFTVDFLNGSEVIYTLEETNNIEFDYFVTFPKTLVVTGYIITVTKVSEAGSVVRLFHTTNPAYVRRSDTLQVSTNLTVSGSQLRSLKASDNVAVDFKEKRTHVTNIIDITTDTLSFSASGSSVPINVHTKMKEPFRQIFGKVNVTYTDPMLDEETSLTSTKAAYNSNINQLLDEIKESEALYFTLYDNDLTGRYVVSDAESQVGWTSGILSDNEGNFAEPPSVRIGFSARPIVEFVVTFDTIHGSLVRDFSVAFLKTDGNVTIYNFENNTEAVVSVIDDTSSISEVDAITVRVHKVSKPNSPAIIMGMPVSSTFLYRGYADVSELISVDLLEELTYDDSIEALGGVSANEVTVVLDNSGREFFFNSNSLVSKQLKRNRKIVPWLGVEIIPGTIEWYTLGTFWSYKWDVPVNGLTATVVGFDTLGLLDTTTYMNHQAQIGKSLGFLFNYVLEDAKAELPFIEYDIDDALYEIIIPYAWFEHASHTAALRKLSLCYPVHAYCDRNGHICVKPQKLRLDYYYDVWADNTNVIDTKYSSLYTALPNIMNVEVCTPLIIDDEQLVQSTAAFNVYDSDSLILNFNAPYIGNLRVVIDCDDTIEYAYAAYSWGIIIDFVGTGAVRSITCTGSCVDISTKTTLTRRKLDSIRLNGAITRDVQSDFIQTTEHASMLIDRLFALSESDKYDAEVEYRGDIALTINDPILLQNGIAPDNRYNIKRHQLSWSGSLTGSADLNT